MTSQFYCFLKRDFDLSEAVERSVRLVHEHRESDLKLKYHLKSGAAEWN